VHNGGQRDMLALKDLSDQYQFVLDGTKALQFDTSGIASKNTNASESFAIGGDEDTRRGN
jgi:hypothetical protein